MKRKFCIMLCGVLAGSAIAACGSTDTTGEETKQEIGSSEKTEDEKETEKDDTSSGGQTVTIWHDGDESIMQVIADEVNEELSDENITVSFEKKSGLTDQLQLYGNDAANGPDLYFYAHDSLGMFAEMGILAPITDFIGEDELDGLLPMTVEAGIYQDTQYLLPNLNLQILNLLQRLPIN